MPFHSSVTIKEKCCVTSCICYQWFHLPFTNFAPINHNSSHSGQQNYNLVYKLRQNKSHVNPMYRVSNGLYKYCVMSEAVPLSW